MSRLSVSVLALLSCLSMVCAVKESTRHAPHKTDHQHNGIHNPVFDQEALLAVPVQKSSHKLDELAELEDDVRLQRLQTLAKSHDQNSDGIIDKDELVEWVKQSFSMLDHEEAMEKMEEEDENADGKVEFSELLNKLYGYSMEELDQMIAGKLEEEEKEVVEVIADDKARFEAADLDKDGALNDLEYMAYFQPDNYPHMHDVEMAHSMKTMDKDGDGAVSLEEFSSAETDDEGRLAAKTSFEEYDKDKDGKLDKPELAAYVMPGSDESARDEAEHLLSMCDDNKDGQLTLEEIVAKEEEFLSSSATDYGRSLHFVKDEL